MMRLLPLVMLLALDNCAPLPVDQAERICVADAQAAQQPRGSVGFGIDSAGHTAANLEISLSSDFLTGRDPEQVYAKCVLDRSGQYPTRPFSSVLSETH